MHSYPKGKEVTTALDERLARVDKGFPDHPVWLTETGWSTYTKTGSSGPVPTTEADAATYGAQVPATIHAHPRVDKAFRFELLDDPGASNPEANYGLIRIDWSAKPEADALRAVLKG
jgi:exo-beta-1,3-glucanase (GH17 family)